MRPIGRSASRGEMPPRVRETRPGSVETVCDVVNLANLTRYAIHGKDRRQELLTKPIRFRETNGELGPSGESKARQKYAGELTRGRDMGRMCAMNVAMKTIT